MSFDPDLGGTFGAEFSLLVDGRFKPSERLDVTGLLATLLLLRWSEAEEAKLEAQATSEDFPHEGMIPSDARWEKWGELRGDELARYVEQRLIAALRAVRGENTFGRRLTMLGNVLDRIIGGRTWMLDPAMALLSSLDFGSNEVLPVASFALETFIGLSTGRAHQGLQSFTPPLVADLIVELGAPKPGDRIYDPCFGLGGLLFGAARRLVKSSIMLPAPLWTKLLGDRFFGIEAAPIPYVIGLARMIFAGITAPNLHLGNALEGSTRDLPTAERFDLVLANPPWGGLLGRYNPDLPVEGLEAQARQLEERAQAKYAHFRIRSRRRENLFLQHTVESLRPGGRAVIAVPEGTLSRRGPDSELREWLLRNLRVEGVVSLPAGAFSPSTGIKVSLLVLRRDVPAASVRFLTVRSLASATGKPVTNAESARDIARRFRTKRAGEDHWDASIEDLAARSWNLTAAPRSQRRLEREIEEIQREDPSVRRRELGDVAEIFVGLTAAREITSRERPTGGAWLPLLQGRDVREGRVGQPSLFLAGDAKRSIGRFQLQPGDLVFPRIGRGILVTPVPEDLHGAIAESSVMVIRPSQSEVRSDYLAAVLNSESYQLWLEESSSALDGAVRVSVDVLRRTPLPLPNPLDQGRIGRLWRKGESVDALRLLARRADSDEIDPLSRWLARSPEARAILQAEPGSSSDQLFLLDQLGHACRQARNKFAPAAAGESRDHEILGPASQMLFFETHVNLRGISKIPPGPTLLSVLESVRGSMGRAVLTLRKQRKRAKIGDLPFAVADRVEELLAAQTENLLARVEFEARLDPNYVEPSQRSEVVLRLVNRSPLALRHVLVSTTAPTGRGQVEFLDEGSEIAVPLWIDAPSEPGALNFDARWWADRIDGRSVSGSVQLAVEIRTPQERAEVPEIGTSPYIVGSPVNRKDMFFGREDVIERVKGQLSTDHRANVILLEGNRRAGKTSILKRLAEPGELPGWIVVYCSFQAGEGAPNQAGLPTREVFRLIARQIGWEASKAGRTTWFPGPALPDPARPFKTQFAAAAAEFFKTERPAEAFAVYLETALEACRPSRILLLLDEFDKLQEGIDAGITSPQVPENLRYLLHEHPDLSAVLSGSRRLKRLREEYWSALFGIGHRIGVSGAFRKTRQGNW